MSVRHRAFALVLLAALLVTGCTANDHQARLFQPR
jgi:hypothetical protein